MQSMSQKLPNVLVTLQAYWQGFTGIDIMAHSALYWYTCLNKVYIPLLSMTKHAYVAVLNPSILLPAVSSLKITSHYLPQHNGGGGWCRINPLVVATFFIITGAIYCRCMLNSLSSGEFTDYPITLLDDKKCISFD